MQPLQHSVTVTVDVTPWQSRMTEDSLIDARAIDNGIGQVSIGQVSLTESCAREIGTIEESA